MGAAVGGGGLMGREVKNGWGAKLHKKDNTTDKIATDFV